MEEAWEPAVVSEDNAVIISPNYNLIVDAGVPTMMAQIRPQWQAKRLIQRVARLLPVDPSSACQRILNASIHDLRDKIRTVGLDIAKEAAQQNKLPNIGSEEDLENYSTFNVINLAYKIGLLSRSEWRRVSRCYEIRRDLEHEDDEYEAGPEDCFYIFSTCINVILSKDPVQLIRVTDVKSVVEQATAAVPDAVILEDFTGAPGPRQKQILEMLISFAMDPAQPDIVQQNSHSFLRYFSKISPPAILTDVGRSFQEKAGRTLDERTIRVSLAANIYPYLRGAAKQAFFERQSQRFGSVSTNWGSYDQHGELLRTYQDVGGLTATPDDLRDVFVLWMLRTYLGSSGGVTRYGNFRPVYFSNVASPLIREIFISYGIGILEDIDRVSANKFVKRALTDEHILSRYEKLIALITEANS